MMSGPVLATEVVAELASLLPFGERSHHRRGAVAIAGNVRPKASIAHYPSFPPVFSVFGLRAAEYLPFSKALPSFSEILRLRIRTPR
jgi:hypothetical protein